MDGRYEEALENAEQALQLCPDLIDEFCARAVKAGALALKGEVSEGLELLRKVRDDIIENDFIPDFPLADLVDYADKVGGLAALAHSPANHARFRLGTDSRRRSLPGLPCHLAPIANTKPCSVDNVC